jgi:hypothetical protein
MDILELAYENSLAQHIRRDPDAERGTGKENLP